MKVVGSVSVRPATADDVADVHRMEVELAVACGCPPEHFRVTEQAISNRITDPDRSAVYVATRGDTILGFVMCNIVPLGWSGVPGIYVEDLYVEPTARRTSAVGTALMRRAARHALDLADRAGDPSAAFLRLDCASSNISGQRFFTRLGAEPANVNFRMTSDALRDLAEESSERT